PRTPAAAFPLVHIVALPHANAPLEFVLRLPHVSPARASPLTRDPIEFTRHSTSNLLPLTSSSSINNQQSSTSLITQFPNPRKSNPALPTPQSTSELIPHPPPHRGNQ